MNISEIFVTIASLNVDEMVGFYAHLFDCSPKTQILGKYAEFWMPGLKLVIFKPQKTHLCEFDDPARSGLSLCVEVDNLEDAIARLNDLGHPPPGDITVASHGREIYAYDLDGNRLILHEKR
ncbi:VOC family protein [Baaleninema simplex]|uniref:VOC family protein n=1 Tax=Baaleninema simplex TaxID=2862350 RepID=UPI000346FD75|nr:glyoxalase/bleomycin resistance/dioxygenase family protein [Baaleninema simplex]